MKGCTLWLTKAVASPGTMLILSPARTTVTAVVVRIVAANGGFDAANFLNTAPNTEKLEKITRYNSGK